MHEENLRHHYALTLRDWCRNLVEHWDEAVDEVGLPTAKVWGLYMAGSRLGFETNVVQLHQVLAVKLDDDGSDGGCRCGRGGRLSTAVDSRGAEFALQQLQRDLFGVAPRGGVLVAAGLGDHAVLLVARLGRVDRGAGGGGTASRSVGAPTS